MSDPIYAWVSPPGLELPLRRSPLRFAAGSPNGASSNSWKLWVTGAGDVYVACRDNFQELKVSLHASGRWRLGFTENAVSGRPDLLPPGADRAWDKWSPPDDGHARAVVAFEIVFLTEELYLGPSARLSWKPLVFVEPSSDTSKMVVVSVCMAPGPGPVMAPPDRSIAVVGVLPLPHGRSVQLVARHDDSAAFKETMAKAAQEGSRRFRAAGRQIPDEGVVFLVGRRDEGARFVTAARIRDEWA